MSEAAAPAAAAPAAPAGGNKMMFIMIGVMFVLLVGGMGGMYMVMNKSSAKGADTTESEEPAKDSKDKKDAKKSDKSTAKAAAIYVGFEPPFVVNFPADSAVKFLQLSVQIMTREATVEHEIKANDPAIRDALLNLFAQQTADKLATAEGKEALRTQSLEAVRGVIKNEGGEADKVEAVYFTSFVMQ